MALTFNTSLTTTAICFLKYSPEPLALIYSENAHIKWVQQNNALKEEGIYIASHRKLDSRTLAARTLSGQKRVPANAWFDDGKFNKVAGVLEDSRHMPSYDGALTLLWADDDISEDEEDW